MLWGRDMSDIQTKVDALLEKLGNALEELVTLNVMTMQTSLTVGKDANGKVILVPKGSSDGTNTPPDAEGLWTSIRLDQGDIVNMISTGALGNAPLMELHKEQVKLSQQIVSDNIKALVDLARSLAK
jgi:hypothetical protein